MSKQEFQGKGKYMKVKEFLENFTGDNHIKIYDMHSFDTMVRTAMAKDDRKLWMSYVNPRLHKMYDELREELMTVEFYKNLAKE